MFLILNVSHESISLALYYNSYYILGEGSMNENSDSDMIIYNIQFKNMKKKKKVSCSADFHHLEKFWLICIK